MPETFVGRFPKIVKRVVTWFSFGSLQLSVYRLSVTRAYCDETAEARITDHAVFA